MTASERIRAARERRRADGVVDVLEEIARLRAELGMTDSADPGSRRPRRLIGRAKPTS